MRNKTIPTLEKSIFFFSKGLKHASGHIIKTPNKENELCFLSLEMYLAVT